MKKLWIWIESINHWRFWWEIQLKNISHELLMNSNVNRQSLDFSLLFFPLLAIKSSANNSLQSQFVSHFPQIIISFITLSNFIITERESHWQTSGVCVRENVQIEFWLKISQRQEKVLQWHENTRSSEGFHHSANVWMKWDERRGEKAESAMWVMDTDKCLWICV